MIVTVTTRLICPGCLGVRGCRMHDATVEPGPDRHQIVPHRLRCIGEPRQFRFQQFIHCIQLHVHTVHPCGNVVLCDGLAAECTGGVRKRERLMKFRRAQTQGSDQVHVSGMARVRRVLRPCQTLVQEALQIVQRISPGIALVLPEALQDRKRGALALAIRVFHRARQLGYMGKLRRLREKSRHFQLRVHAREQPTVVLQHQVIAEVHHQPPALGYGTRYRRRTRGIHEAGEGASYLELQLPTAKRNGRAALHVRYHRMAESIVPERVEQDSYARAPPHLGQRDMQQGAYTAFVFVLPRQP